jgi:catechol 2,3-dioxygenase-like lactoylglutathione lyase family enzyme
VTAPDSFEVGGVRLPRPFRVRRLGHFGIYVEDPEGIQDFYCRLLGLRVSDHVDYTGRLPEEQMQTLGPRKGYFTRHGTEHHSFVIFPKRVAQAVYNSPADSDITINQITWQVGSLREVVDGFDWFTKRGFKIHRAGRDLPGSNWNVYPKDPEGHVNEIFYGIEQVGWDGLSKPMAMHATRYTAPPSLPHPSEFSEVSDARARDIDLQRGWQAAEAGTEKYDVGGVLLGRPFKVTRVGPVRLFVDDLEKCLPFYRDDLGLSITEEVRWNGHRCVFLRANTEHHSIALYPKAMRAELGLSASTSLFSFGMQLGDYRQLRDAVEFLRREGVTIRYLPPELFPGIDYCAFAIDPDGHAIQLYYYMEQVGWDGRPRPAESRVRVDNTRWPDTVPAASDTFLGENFLGPWG